MTALLFLGLLVYIGVGKLKGYQMLLGNGKVGYIRPVVTGHEGELLPNIELLLSDSTSYLNLQSIRSGIPIVLFYFGPDCPFCQSEIEEIITNMPHLRKVRFYLITPYRYSDMKGFINKYQLYEYDNIITGVDYKFKFGSYFKTQVIPYLAVYSSDRRLLAAFAGNIKYGQIKAISGN
jgi:thiol-disulfide isomerase/thioredoxin